MAAEKVGSIYYELDLDTMQFKQSAEQAERAAKNLGKKIKNDLGPDVAATQQRIVDFTKYALVGMTIAIGAAISAIAVGAVNAANTMESTMLKYETILGSQQKATIRAKEIADFAARTPFNTADISKGDIILTNFGIRSERTLNIVGNAAAITGDSFGELSLILGQISQSKELENIKQLMSRGALSIDELRKAGIKFAKDGSIVNGVQDTYNKVLNILEVKFAGGMEKLSQTLPGKMSTLFDNINLKLAEFASETGLLDGLKSLVGMIGTLVEQIDIKAIAQGLKDFAFSIKESAKAIVEFFNANPGALPGILAALGTALIVTLIPALWGLAAGMAATTAAFIAANTPLIVLSGLIGGFIALFNTPESQLSPFFRQLKVGFEETLKVVKDVVRGIIGWFQDLISRITIALADLEIAAQGVQRELNRVVGRMDEVEKAQNRIDQLNRTKTNASIDAGWVAGPKVPEPAIKATGIGLAAMQKNYVTSFTNIAKEATSFKGNMTDLLNPQKRNSPSIVDWVRMGTQKITDIYSGMYTELELMTGSNKEVMTASVQSLNASVAGGGKSIAQTPITINQNLSGVMTRSRGELRDVAVDLLQAANEELKARGQNPIANFNY